MGDQGGSQHLLAEFGKLRSAIEEKVKRQRGTRSIFDNAVLGWSGERPVSPDSARFMRWLLVCWRSGGRARFVSFEERLEEKVGGYEWPEPLRVCSQGTFDTLRWRGRAMLKSAQDLAMYSMLLQELRPRSVLEIGSGEGGSAAWFSDVARLNGEPVTTLSVDCCVPDPVGPDVVFVKGYAEALEDVLEGHWVRALPHPWLVVEDAHVGLRECLTSLDRWLQPGDYLVIEDSRNKQETLKWFVLARPGRYLVDTRYTDFFGRNCVSAENSVFCRLGDGLAGEASA